MSGNRYCTPSFVTVGAATVVSESIGSGTARALRSSEAATRLRRTDSAHDVPIAPNRLAELPEATRRDQVWVSDITYIQTDEGWLYLAVIMDLYGRRIIGWAFAHHLGTELVAAALAMALVHRRPPEGLVHHSDRGVQYASAAYRK